MYAHLSVVNDVISEKKILLRALPTKGRRETCLKLQFINIKYSTM